MYIDRPADADPHWFFSWTNQTAQHGVRYSYAFLRRSLMPSASTPTWPAQVLCQKQAQVGFVRSGLGTTAGWQRQNRKRDPTEWRNKQKLSFTQHVSLVPSRGVWDSQHFFQMQWLLVMDSGIRAIPLLMRFRRAGFSKAAATRSLSASLTKENSIRRNAALSPSPSFHYQGKPFWVHIFHPLPFDLQPSYPRPLAVEDVGWTTQGSCTQPVPLFWSTRCFCSETNNAAKQLLIDLRAELCAIAHSQMAGDSEGAKPSWDF